MSLSPPQNKMPIRGVLPEYSLIWVLKQPTFPPGVGLLSKIKIFHIFLTHTFSINLAEDMQAYFYATNIASLVCKLPADK